MSSIIIVNVLCLYIRRHTGTDSCQTTSPLSPLSINFSVLCLWFWMAGWLELLVYLPPSFECRRQAFTEWTDRQAGRARKGWTGRQAPFCSQLRHTHTNTRISSLKLVWSIIPLSFQDINQEEFVRDPKLKNLQVLAIDNSFFSRISFYKDLLIALSEWYWRKITDIWSTWLTQARLVQVWCVVSLMVIFFE